MDSISRNGIILAAEEKTDLQKGFRLTQIIWAVLLVSLGLYILMAYFIDEEVRQSMQLGDFLKTLEAALLAVSAATLVIIKYLKPLILKAKMASMSGVEMSPTKRILQKYTTAMVVAMALAESIGVYGLVLFLMGSELMTMYVFMAISALGMYIYRPKYEEIEQLALEMKRDLRGR